MYDSITQFVNYFAIYLGMFFISLFPILALVSQVALAIRECAINSRKEESYSDTNYKSLEWVAYFIFYTSWLFLVAGVILLIGAFTVKN